MYDIEREAVKNFIEKELTSANYEIKEILGEQYVVVKE